MNAIIVDGLTKAYGAATAVDNVSFTASAGRVTGSWVRTVPAAGQRANGVAVARRSDRAEVRGDAA